MAATSSALTGPKGRPPLRPCPDDFEVIFVEQGRLGCEAWYRASRMTVNRWMKEHGEAQLIQQRAEYVAHQRAHGQWITRQTRMVEHREVRNAAKRMPIRDRRRIHPTLARQAARHLRIVRNGGFIVSPAGSDEWWVGSRRMSAAQMVDLAESKGFDRSVTLQGAGGEEVEG
jgi:hypothetical protein